MLSFIVYDLLECLAFKSKTFHQTIPKLKE